MDAHGLVSLVKHFRQPVIVERRRAALELAELGLERLAGRRARDDGDKNAVLRLSAAGDLRGVPGAQARRAREGEARQALEDGALARRLVADDDELLG